MKTSFLLRAMMLISLITSSVISIPSTLLSVGDPQDATMQDSTNIRKRGIEEVNVPYEQPAGQQTRRARTVEPQQEPQAAEPQQQQPDSDFSQDDYNRLCSGNKEMANAKLRGAKLSGKDLSLSGVNFTGADLREANLDGVVLCAANLSGANLTGATLKQAVLSEYDEISDTYVKADLSGAILAGADFTGAMLNGIDLTHTQISNTTKFVSAQMSKVDLHGLTLGNVDFSDAILSNAILNGTTFDGTILIRSTLTNAELANSTFTNNANLVEADLDYAKMQNATFSNTRMQRASIDNATVVDVRIINNTDLSSANLQNLKFNNATIENANLTDATLKKIEFVNSHLRNVEMQKSQSPLVGNREIDNVAFIATELTNINFQGSTLKGILVFGNDCLGTNINFEGAFLENCMFLGNTKSQSVWGLGYAPQCLLAIPIAWVATGVAVGSAAALAHAELEKVDNPVIKPVGQAIAFFGTKAIFLGLCALEAGAGALAAIVSLPVETIRRTCKNCKNEADSIDNINSCFVDSHFSGVSMRSTYWSFIHFRNCHGFENISHAIESSFCYVTFEGESNKDFGDDNPCASGVLLMSQGAKFNGKYIPRFIGFWGMMNDQALVERIMSTIGWCAVSGAASSFGGSAGAAAFRAFSGAAKK